MTCRRLLLALAIGLSSGAGCGPSEDRGPVHRVYLADPDDEPSGAAGAAAGAGPNGAAGEAGAPPMIEPPEPPVVGNMLPLSGPYGTEVRITGSDLGSAARPGVSLVLGPGEERELQPKTKPEIISWTETEIRFRFPFPHAGQVLIRTPQGEDVAGEFEPTWLPGPPHEVPAGTTSLTAIADAEGSLRAVLDDSTPVMVAYDGVDWSESAVPGSNLRRDSIRLYTQAGELRAFALSTATTPEIIGLDPLDGFAQSPTGLKTTSDYRVAGAADGATVWWRSGNNWSRARPSTGVWAGDKGPIADPNPSGADHVAGASADGTLFVGWSEDTGTTFPPDDRGAPMHRRLPAAAASFEGKVRTGNDMDDSISSYTMVDRGSGVLARYCGTDEDPLGVSGDDKLCYHALLPTGAKATVREAADHRYGIGSSAQVALYCSGTQGLRLLPALGGGGTTHAKLDAIAGDVVAWPCANVVALEVDAAGDALFFIEAGGKLYSPRPRVR